MSATAAREVLTSSQSRTLSFDADICLSVVLQGNTFDWVAVSLQL